MGNRIDRYKRNNLEKLLQGNVSSAGWDFITTEQGSLLPNDILLRRDGTARWTIDTFATYASAKLGYNVTAGNVKGILSEMGIVFRNVKVEKVKGPEATSGLGLALRADVDLIMAYLYDLDKDWRTKAQSTAASDRA